MTKHSFAEKAPSQEVGIRAALKVKSNVRQPLKKLVLAVQLILVMVACIHYLLMVLIRIRSFTI